MQDFQSIPGVAGRIFGSGGGGGGGGGGADLRRLRGYPAGAAQQPPVKCPRCDSTNTKFCYYNNYNLSQPRHFCKACRRYWTKGGVLRNVPVGGGCRKSKRSSSSSSSSSSKTSRSSSTAGDKDRRRPSASRSSSDSSSLTAAATTTEASTSATASASASASASSPFPESALFVSTQTSHPNPPFDPPQQTVGLDTLGHQTPDIFSQAAAGGSFTGLIAATTSSAVLGFNFSDPSPIRVGPQQPAPKEATTVAEEIRMPLGLLDHTVPSDLPPFQGRPGSSVGGLTGLDWPASVDPSLFDLTSAVDPGAYWNQGHWGDTDPSLYLP